MLNGIYTVAWTRLRPPHVVSSLVQLGEGFDIPATALLARTRLTAEILANPRSLITGVDEVQVVRNLHSALPGVHHLGLLSGQLFASTWYSHLGYAWSACSSIREILSLAARFYPLTYAMTLATVHQGSHGHTAHFAGDTLPDDVAAYYQWRDIANTVHVLREVCEPSDTFGTTYAGPPMSTEAVATAVGLFGEEPKRGTSFSFTIGPELLDRPLRRSAPHTVAMMVEECERSMAALASAEQASGPVRENILRRLQDGARLDEVAQDMHVSPRTLRRRLQAEGTNYRDLVEAVRAAEAERLLATTGLGVSQIAQKLGYENPSAFTTAFRRWHATTPTDYRQHTTS